MVVRLYGVKLKINLVIIKTYQLIELVIILQMMYLIEDLIQKVYLTIEHIMVNMESLIVLKNQ